MFTYAYPNATPVDFKSVATNFSTLMSGKCTSQKKDLIRQVAQLGCDPRVAIFAETEGAVNSVLGVLKIDGVAQTVVVGPSILDGRLGQGSVFEPIPGELVKSDFGNHFMVGSQARFGVVYAQRLVKVDGLIDQVFMAVEAPQQRSLRAEEGVADLI